MILKGAAGTVSLQLLLLWLQESSHQLSVQGPCLHIKPCVPLNTLGLSKQFKPRFQNHKSCCELMYRTGTVSRSHACLSTPVSPPPNTPWPHLLAGSPNSPMPLPAISPNAAAAIPGTKSSAGSPRSNPPIQSLPPLLRPFPLLLLLLLPGLPLLLLLLLLEAPRDELCLCFSCCRSISPIAEVEATVKDSKALRRSMRRSASNRPSLPYTMYLRNERGYPSLHWLDMKWRIPVANKTALAQHLAGMHANYTYHGISQLQLG